MEKLAKAITTIRPLRIAERLRGMEQACLLSEDFAEAEAFRDGADEIERLYGLLSDLLKSIPPRQALFSHGMTSEELGLYDSHHRKPLEAA